MTCLDGPGKVFPVSLDVISNETGDICVAEISKNYGFSAQRFYCLVNVKGERGGHAHKALRQLLIAMSGSVSVVIDNGSVRDTFILDSPSKGLLINPMVWREIMMDNNAVLGVLASLPYDEDDYIRDYNDFINTVNSEHEILS